MRHSIPRRLRIAFCLLLSPTFAAADGAPIGFFAASVEAQRDAEEVFLATPAGAKARRWLFQLTEEPHVAGTPQEKKVAEYVRDKLTEFGLEAEMVGYEVFLNHPEHVSLQLVEPVEEPLALMEDFVDGDKDSTDRGMFPGFHGYGASGKASGQVVYVNYATPTTSRSWRSSASRPRAASSWRATARSSAASRYARRRRPAPPGSSSSPTRPTTAT